MMIVRPEPDPHRPGEYAYFDSFAGLLPCRVVDVDRFGLVELEMTGSRVYPRGTRRKVHQNRAVPRENVVGLRSKTGPRIVGGWRWER